MLLGAIDGKHIVVQAQLVEDFSIIKKTCSIVKQAEACRCW